jgi:hypothetical protein
MLSPRPPSSTPPSIWKADVAAPQTKSGGKAVPAAVIMLNR